MTWRVCAFLLVACAVGACAGRRQVGEVGLEQESSPVAEVGEARLESPSEPPSSRTFIVASGDGLREVGIDGREVRVIGSTPASRARLLASGEVLYVNPETLELRRLHPETAVDTLVAAIPRHPECGDSPEDSLEIQSAADFVIDEERAAVCLRLMDRNANMADYGIDVRIDLDGENLRESVWLSPSCPEDESGAGPFDCAEGGTRHHGGSPPGAATGLPDEYLEESRSLSGSWALISGPPETGDYIYRSLFLRDTSSDSLYPIVEGDWPPPLDLSAPLDEVATVRAVGESTIRWLDGDLLQIDELLVNPGSRAVQLGGRLAR